MFQAILLSVLVVAICTTIHYFMLKHVSDWIAGSNRTAHGRHLAVTVSAITTAHVVEAFIYTLIFVWAVQGLDLGTLKVSGPDAKNVTLMDYFYFSLVNFTTLGRGT